MAGRSLRRVNWGRVITVAVPYAWLLAFFLAPFLIVLKISVSQPALAMPPYLPTWDSWSAMLHHIIHPDFSNYQFLFSDPLYIEAYLNSLRVAGIATLMTLLIGYPIAYGIARSSANWRATLLMMVILPFWTSFLIRVYSWIGILKNDGLLNAFLDWTGLFPLLDGLGVFDLMVAVGLLDQAPTLPLTIMYTPAAVYIGIVYSYLPFMILPLYASLEKLDLNLLEAASDLGARPFTVFRRVTVPMTLPGIAAGCFLVFIPAVGEFVIPDLLGGSSTLMIGRTLWGEFFQNRDWPIASAVAVLLLLVLVVPIVVFQRIAKRGGTG